MRSNEESRSRTFREARDSVLHVLAPALPLRRLLQRGAAISRSLRERRPKRPRKLQKLRAIFDISLG